MVRTCHCVRKVSGVRRRSNVFDTFLQGSPLRLSIFSNSQMCLSLWLTALECVFSNEDRYRNLYVKFLTRHQHQGEKTWTYMLSPERFFTGRNMRAKVGGRIWKIRAGCTSLSDTNV